MIGSSSKPSPDCWESSVARAIAEPLVPRLIAMLGLRGCWFEPFPFDVQLPRIESGRIVLPPDEPGVRSWALDMGVELPVRYSGLTLGRYVLVAASPTTGVDFSPASRAEALSMVAPVGSLIAAAMVAESERPATSWNAAPPAVDTALSGGGRPVVGSAGTGTRSHPTNVCAAHASDGATGPPVTTRAREREMSVRSMARPTNIRKPPASVSDARSSQIGDDPKRRGTLPWTCEVGIDVRGARHRTASLRRPW